PAGFSPSALQTICRFAGNAGEGVHVRMVLPPLHSAVVGSGSKVIKSMKSTAVAVGFMASLNLKTSGAEGETPLAGGGEVRIGSAWAGERCRSARVRIKSPRK